MGKKLTQKEFEERVKKIHGNNIDLSNAIYLGDDVEVECKCNICGNVWLAKPNKLKIGHGCRICGVKKIWEKRKDKTITEDIIKKMKKIFPNYDFSKNEEIINQKQKIIIYCDKHGEFTSTPDSILHRHGCRKCQYEKLKETFSLNKKDIIKKAREVHGCKYIYTMDWEYNGVDTPMKIICPIHGEFEQTPYKHINRRQGCPICNQSHLEEEIRLFLENKNINFLQGANKSKLTWLGLQHLDFYLPQHNIAIECQGEQHYKPKSFNKDKTEETLTKNITMQQERDQRKKRLCEENGIKLLYYTDYNGVEEDNLITFKDKEKLLECILNER